MPITRQGTSNNVTQEVVRAMIDQAMQRNSTNGELNVLSAFPLVQEDGIGTLGHEAAYAMTWETIKKKITNKYCPRELALICTKFVSDENEKEKEKVDKYISVLPDIIHGNVMSARPKTLDEAIELANDLMYQKLRTYAERQTKSKMKFDNNNQAQQIPKRQNVAQAYAVRTGKRKECAGTLPLCNKCKFHHNGPCTTKCTNYKKVGHLTRDCWNPTATSNQNTITFYECRNQGHYKSDCP
nr:hypothetical protein [Tanacetum cinerariifolium]